MSVGRTEARTTDFVAYAGMMLGAYRASASVQAGVDAWDATGRPTSEWPGWAEIIGSYQPAVERPERCRRTPVSWRVRAEVFARDGHICRFCGTDDCNLKKGAR